MAPGTAPHNKLGRRTGAAAACSPQTSTADKAARTHPQEGLQAVCYILPDRLRVLQSHHGHPRLQSWGCQA
jgi:hypothetical protein